MRENMRKAWKRVKSNKGAPGIDGMSVQEFPEFSRNNWDSIRQSLLDGADQPLPVKSVEIPKPTGGKRPLGIPTVVSVKELWVKTCPVVALAESEALATADVGGALSDGRPYPDRLNFY